MPKRRQAVVDGTRVVFFSIFSGDNIRCSIKGVELDGTISPIMPLSEEVRGRLDAIERSGRSSFPMERIELSKEFVSFSNFPKYLISLSLVTIVSIYTTHMCHMTSYNWFIIYKGDRRGGSARHSGGPS